MNTQFHTPSFGDEIFDLGDASTSTNSFVPGNQIHHNINSSHMNQQQQTPPTTKRMIRLLNTSDEYYTANEESFNVTANNSMNSPIVQQQNANIANNVLSGGQAGNATPTSATTAGLTTMAARKQTLPLDQSEPAKPLSAYALFFRDTVSAIKHQNPSCSFQELSKIVSSMWDALDPVHKGVYNKKNEMAKIEYLKQMKIYQQQQQLKKQQLNTTANETTQNTTNPQQTQQQMAAPQVTPSPQAIVNNIRQQNAPQINNNNAANTNTSIPAPASTTAATTGAPSDDQIRLLTEACSVQKCTRENCNKRAIINPDWEDEYCSNECVIIHCRNVFNAWVQSNLELKQQQQQQQQQQQTTTQQTTTT